MSITYKKMPSTYNRKYYEENADTLRRKENSYYHYHRAKKNGDTNADADYAKYGDHYGLMMKYNRLQQLVLQTCPQFIAPPLLPQDAIQ